MSEPNQGLSNEGSEADAPLRSAAPSGSRGERAPPPYEIVEHTADIGFRVEGRDLAQLFARAALALHDVIADTDAARPAVERPIGVEGRDVEDALVRFLE